MNLKRLLAFIGLTMFVFVSGIVTLILFPQPLFSHSYEYKNFKIHANYSVEQVAFNHAIEEAIKRIRLSEIYNETYNYDIFLADNTFYNKIDDLILGKWSAARAIANNVFIKRKVEAQKGIVHNGKNQFDLAYVLAHEMTHCLQAHKYGKLKFNPIYHPPMWKLEGYPEYLSRRDLLESESYNLKKGINDFLERSTHKDPIIQISAKESTPYIYYKSRLMMEYLMDIKQLSYSDILDDSIKEVTVYGEMLEWHQQE